jgi:hypothetical protein
MRLTTRTTLAAIVLGIIVSVIACGYFMPYWRKVDQDVVLAYQGFLFNDGAPQNYFDHTGYLFYLAIGAWYALLHAIGLMPIAAASALPPTSDLEAFNAAWTTGVRAGRVFSMLLVCGFVLAFYTLVRRLYADRRIGVIAALALAVSGSAMLHARMLRTELMSALFTTLALLCALIAAQEPRRGRQGLMLAGAGLCAMLALETKIQALIVLLAFPPIVVAFGSPPDAKSHGGGYGRAVALALAAALLIPFAANVLWRAWEAPGVLYPQLGMLPRGFYQIVLMAWPVAWSFVFAWAWGRRMTDAALAVVALAAGAALGVMVLLLRYEPANLAAITHPVEHMFAFTTVSHPELTGSTVSAGVLGQIGPALLEGFGSHFFVLNPTARPTLLVEWFALAMALPAWKRGRHLAALRVLVLVGAAWGIDSVFALRGLKDAYLAYTDPLLILAGALMLKENPGLFASRKARAWGGALLGLSLLWSHVEPIKMTLSKRDPAIACDWLPTYLPAVQFPFCAGAGPPTISNPLRRTG